MAVTLGRHARSHKEPSAASASCQPPPLLLLLAFLLLPSVLLPPLHVASPRLQGSLRKSGDPPLAMTRRQAPLVGASALEAAASAAAAGMEGPTTTAAAAVAAAVQVGAQPAQAPILVGCLLQLLSPTLALRQLLLSLLAVLLWPAQGLPPPQRCTRIARELPAAGHHRQVARPAAAAAAAAAAAGP